MTQEINDGGLAFPHDERDANGQFRQHFGMTLRDYFAGQALPQIAHDWCECNPKHYEAVALNAYKLADAMIAARCAHAKSDSETA